MAGEYVIYHKFSFFRNDPRFLKYKFWLWHLFWNHWADLNKYCQA